jgi:hypothetical protein
VIVFVFVLAVVLALVVAVVIAVARDHGPTPADVATSYELAWDHLDFDSLYALSGAELRDGLDRHAFVSAKRVAYSGQPGLGALASEIAIVDLASAGAAAVVVTQVTPRQGAPVRNRIDLARRSGRWEVVGYRLAPSAGATAASAN